MSTPSRRDPGTWPDAFVAAICDQALARAHGETPAAIAITGLQGTGKSTLSAQLVATAAQRGVEAVALSIDDFYLGRRERQALGRRVHPLLATRGPPGSHDVALACAVLDALHAGRGGVAIPRFDKIADRRLPPSRWRVQRRPVGLVVFEGWFLRVPPQPPEALRQPVNRLEREEDPDGSWRGYVNQALADDFPALWSRLGPLLLLAGPGFEVVRDWRWQQEQALQRAHPGRRAMRRDEVERFILFFERVSRHALEVLPAVADRVIRLDAQRQVLG